MSLLDGYRIKLDAISKWNLKFSGETNSIPLNAFLDRVEELRYARQIDFDHLLRASCDLFEGSALIFYRANRKYFNTWTELVLALKDEFLPPDYDDKLIDEIKRRTQGPNESIGMYIAVMTNLFNRLSSRVSEDTQLKIIFRNLCPFYLTQMGYNKINSINELKIIGRKIEALKSRVDAYSLPPAGENTLEPDLAYANPIKEPEPVPEKPGTVEKCQEIGKSAIACTTSNELRCYGCGLENVTRKTCTECSRNRKLTREVPIERVSYNRSLNINADNACSLLEVPAPINVRELRRVLFVVNCFRRFVPNFENIVAPLNNLLRKKVRFAWNTECEIAFNDIQNYLVAATVRYCPDFSLPFIVQTNASEFDLSAILYQNTSEGEKVICYLNRSLNSCGRKCSSTEKECLAVLFAVEKLRQYLERSKFTVITDRHSLIWLKTLKRPTDRLACWAARLRQFEFDIVHRKGEENVVPDALSQAVPAIGYVFGEDEEISDPWYIALRDKIMKDPARYSRFRIKGNCILKYVKSRYPDLDEDNFAWKLVVPKDKRERLLYRCHDLPNAGHGGSYKTYERLKVKHTWPRMRGDVERYVRRCKVCAASKPEQKRTAGLMATRRTASKPWEMIAMDCIGPLPPSTRGYRYILVITDCFSKFVLTFPLRSITAAAVCRCVEEHIFLMFGSPRWIICDNGKEFKNKEFQKLARSFGCVIQYNANYHPQANPTERVNRVIKTMLTCYVSENHRKWDKFLPAISCAIRTARHEVTGLTPYFINFGREMTALGSETEVPVEGIDAKRSTDYVKRSDEMNNVYKDVRERLTKAHARYKVRYDLRKRDIEYLPNQLVWKRNFVLSDASKYYAAKLAPKFVGPFKIKKKVSPWTYELEDLKGGYKGMFHAKDLKPADRDPEDDELS